MWMRFQSFRERSDILSISLTNLLYTLEVIWTILWWILVFDSEGHYELSFYVKNFINILQKF